MPYRHRSKRRPRSVRKHVSKRSQRTPVGRRSRQTWRRSPQRNARRFRSSVVTQHSAVGSADEERTNFADSISLQVEYPITIDGLFWDPSIGQSTQSKFGYMLIDSLNRSDYFGDDAPRMKEKNEIIDEAIREIESSWIDGSWKVYNTVKLSNERSGGFVAENRDVDIAKEDLPFFLQLYDHVKVSLPPSDIWVFTCFDSDDARILPVMDLKSDILWGTGFVFCTAYPRWRIPPKKPGVGKVHLQIRVPRGHPLLLTIKDLTTRLTTISSPFCEMLCFPKKVQILTRTKYKNNETIVAMELIDSIDVDSLFTSMQPPITDKTIFNSFL